MTLERLEGSETTYLLLDMYFRPRNKMLELSSPSSEDLSLQTSEDELAESFIALRKSV